MRKPKSQGMFHQIPGRMGKILGAGTNEHRKNPCRTMTPSFDGGVILVVNQGIHNSHAARQKVIFMDECLVIGLSIMARTVMEELILGDKFEEIGRSTMEEGDTIGLRDSSVLIVKEIGHV